VIIFCPIGNFKEPLSIFEINVGEKGVEIAIK
jgi:hypothetical protein